MWSILANLLKRRSAFADFPDAKPTGFITVFPKVEMTIEERNQHFIDLFDLKKRISVSSSEIVKG